jgi:hypothetical protein
MNAIVKNFQSFLKKEIEIQKKSISTDVERHLEEIKKIEFEIFTNNSPFTGDCKNRIFFVWHDHYSANSGTYMQVGELMHPHRNMDDRGYINGVVTDLDGYCKLRSANRLSHNLDVVASFYFPKFQKSKHREEYITICQNEEKSAISELDKFVKSQKDAINDRLIELTGLGLLGYLRDI